MVSYGCSSRGFEGTPQQQLLCCGGLQAGRHARFYCCAGCWPGSECNLQYACSLRIGEAAESGQPVGSSAAVSGCWALCAGLSCVVGPSGGSDALLIASLAAQPSVAEGSLAAISRTLEMPERQAAQ